mmetsp:Transcript_26525/g.37014  ORF Transcript_26525/g.37014 Transcript_26525/m.37014 type:complete len:89 (-) Transcript_26525:99-365(-)
MGCCIATCDQQAVRSQKNDSIATRASKIQHFSVWFVRQNCSDLGTVVMLLGVLMLDASSPSHYYRLRTQSRRNNRQNVHPVQSCSHSA